HRPPAALERCDIEHAPGNLHRVLRGVEVAPEALSARQRAARDDQLAAAALRDEMSGDQAAEVAGRTGDEYLHGAGVPANSPREREDTAPAPRPAWARSMPEAGSRAELKGAGAGWTSAAAPAAGRSRRSPPCGPRAAPGGG